MSPNGSVSMKKLTQFLVFTSIGTHTAIAFLFFIAVTEILKRLSLLGNQFQSFFSFGSGLVLVLIPLLLGIRRLKQTASGPIKNLLKLETIFFPIAGLIAWGCLFFH